MRAYTRAVVAMVVGVGGFVLTSAALNGCAVSCYEITVLPQRRIAIVMDTCRGTVEYVPVPALPDETPPEMKQSDPKAKVPA
jgi:hypothetical protein